MKIKLSEDNKWLHIFSWVVSGVSLLGYLIQSLIFAFTQPVILDEASFLIKGYWFATGVYTPFQAYGPWTNKMPLAYLIPGWVQTLFSPGLRTGRLLAVFLGILIIIGIWSLVRRITNIHWAAISILVVCLTPNIVKTYSQFWSQGLAAVFLVWSLYFLLGKSNPKWWVYIAAIFGMATALVRQNLIFYPALLILFTFWKYGRKTGWFVTAISSGIFFTYHALYFPEILRLWLVWLPKTMKNMITGWGILIPPTFSSDLSVTLAMQFDSFWMGIRHHFLLLLLITISLIFTPWHLEIKKTKGEQPASFSNLKDAVFLISSFIVLLLTHAMASLSGSYCMYCFSNYLDFFILLGLPLVALTSPHWKFFTAKAGQLVIYLSTTGIVSLIFLYQNWKPTAFLYRLFETNVPRMKNFKILTGTVPLSQIITNKLHIPDYETYYLFLHKISIIGIILITGLLVLLFSLLLHKFIKKQFTLTFGTSTLLVLMAFSFTLSPTVWLSRSETETTCGNIIHQYESIAQTVEPVIPEGTKVFWYGNEAAMLMLYLPNREVLPQRLNDEFGVRDNSDTDQLLSLGLYNEEVITEWTQTADYLLITEAQFQMNPDLLIWLSQNGYTEPVALPAICTNSKDSIIHVYRKP